MAAGRPLRLACPESFEGIGRLLADDLREGLGLDVELTVVGAADLPAATRVLVEKALTPPWDVLVHAWFDLSSEAPPAVVHREFFGRDGAFRAGPLDAGFDELFDDMKVQIDGDRLVEVATRIDSYVHDQALALFLCAPQALYAVDKHVSFGPYRTTFEIDEVTVDEGHWSRAGGGGAPTGSETVLEGAVGTVAGHGAPAAREPSPTGRRLGFSGAAGNAC